MLTVLFWNIQKKPLLGRVARLAERHAAHIVLLAECAADPAAVLAALNPTEPATWAHPPSLPGKVRLFARLKPASVVTLFTSPNGRMAVWEVHPAGGRPVLLAGAHLPSKSGGWTDAGQAALVQELAKDLERIEDERNTARTVLVGDLNMDPFAPGVVGGFGLHALMTRDLAARRSRRVVDGRACRRTFFNPMWGFLTDRPGRPSGTYYRRKTDAVNHFWHAPDQVLVRPGLADKLIGVEIIDHDGTERLTADGGWPDARHGSDHLPVIFSLGT